MAAHQVIDMITGEVTDFPTVIQAADDNATVMEEYNPLFDGELDDDDEESAVPSIENDDDNDDMQSLFESTDDDTTAEPELQQPAQTGLLLLPCQSLALPSAPKQRPALPTPAIASTADVDAAADRLSTPATSSNDETEAPAQSTTSPTRRGRGRPKSGAGGPTFVPKMVYLCRFGCSAGTDQARAVVGTLQKAFDTVIKLRGHMRSEHNLVHPKDQVENQRCNTCKQLFPDADKAQNHFKDCWPTTEAVVTPPQWKAMPQPGQERADTWAYQIDGTPSRDVRFRWNEAINKGEVINSAPTAVVHPGNSHNSPHDSAIGSPTPRGSKRKASTDLQDMNDVNITKRSVKRTKQRHTEETIDLTDESSSTSAPIAQVSSAVSRLSDNMMMLLGERNVELLQGTTALRPPPPLQPIQTQPASQPQQDASDDVAVVDKSAWSAAEETANARHLKRQAERDRQDELARQRSEYQRSQDMLQHQLAAQQQEAYRRQMVARQQQAWARAQQQHAQEQYRQQMMAQQQAAYERQQARQQQAHQQLMAQQAAGSMQAYSSKLGLFQGADGTLYEQGMDGVLRPF